MTKSSSNLQSFLYRQSLRQPSMQTIDIFGWQAAQRKLVRGGRLIAAINSS